MTKRHLTVSLVVAVLGVGTPTYAVGSAGKLDKRGGHHCVKHCAKDGLKKGQYHCHIPPCSKRDVRRHQAHGH